MKRFVLLSCMLFFAMLTKAANVDKGYKIDVWDYEAQVHTNNVWDVTEKMTVTFLEERHGIYRYIPRLFARAHATNGGFARYTYYTSIDNVSVDDYEYALQNNEDSQDNLVIRIGSEEELVSGQHTYVIRYRMQYQDDRYTAADELAHVILGPDCNTSIDSFSYHIVFDKALPQRFELHTFNGEWGDEKSTLDVHPVVTTNEIYGYAKDIKPFCGISLRAELPEGFWTDTKKASSTLYYVAFGAFCILFVIAISYLIFHRRRRPTMVIEYNAPEGISSAEVGVIIDNKADLSDLTSLIVWFASQGYIKIREIKTKDEDDIELVKLKSLPSYAPKYQQIFWKMLFKKSVQIRLGELGDQHEQIADALKALSHTFKGERKLTKMHYPSFWASLGAITTGAFAICNSGSVANYSENEGIFGMIFWVTLMAAFFIRLGLSSYDMIKGKMWRLGHVIVIAILAGIEYMIFSYGIYEEHDYFAPLSQLLIIILGGWSLALFAARAERDTDYRKQQMSLLLGFREFIKKSELPMLQALVDENPSYFYEVLPYAMVFGLSKKWRKHFEKIKMEAPDWYETTGNTGNLTSLMAADRLSNHVSKFIDHSIQVSSHDLSQSSSSTSSSSFGGGFSGGGGGGVGSW